MRTILLGPNGQLGTDIRAVNSRMGNPVSIMPVDRSVVDLSDIEAVSRFFSEQNFSLLINCSGYHKTDEVEHNANLAFTINAHLVERLADICTTKKARFLHISTDYVFGTPDRRTPLSEGDPKSPINVYGASKALGEDLALMTGDHVVIVRVASLFGVAGASGKGGNFVEMVLGRGRRNDPLRIVDDQIMSPTSTADVAAILIEMMQDVPTSGIWHVVNSGSASWYEFAAKILEQAGIQARIEPIPTREFPTTAKRPSYSVLNNSKLASAFRPMGTWQQALKTYLLEKGHISR